MALSERYEYRVTVLETGELHVYEYYIIDKDGDIVSNSKRTLVEYPHEDGPTLQVPLVQKIAAAIWDAETIKAYRDHNAEMQAKTIAAAGLAVQDSKV